jgi:outer membrane protein assembly factor BamB
VDLKGRKVAWSFATDGATRNAAALTSADGSPNYRAAMTDSFYDSMVIGVDRMMSVGAVLSSPLVEGDTLYFGSWDGQLYALG